MSRVNFLSAHLDSNALEIDTASVVTQAHYVFLAKTREKPFTSSTLKDFNIAYKLAAHYLPTGRYIVSFHYISENAKEGSAPNLIVARRDSLGYRWEQEFNGHVISGFYSDLQVVECVVTLDKNANYEFILNGSSKGQFHIQNFLIRAENIDTKYTGGKNVLWNNYPVMHDEK